MGDLQSQQAMGKTVLGIKIAHEIDQYKRGKRTR